MNNKRFRSCGKGLWKNLWRLWKSVGFQQLFRVFPTLHLPQKPCIGRCINDYIKKIIKLCRHSNSAARWKIFGKKLAKCQMNRRETGWNPDTGKIICGKFTNLQTV